MTQFKDEDIARTAAQLADITNVLMAMDNGPLAQFCDDLKGVDPVEEALISGFAANAQKRIRELTIQQVDLLLSLIKTVDLLGQAKKDHKACLSKQREVQNQIQKGVGQNT